MKTMATHSPRSAFRRCGRRVAITPFVPAGVAAAAGLGLSLALVGAAPLARADAGITRRTVILTGQQAPGVEAGVVVSGFTGGYTHPQPAPSIDDEGNVAFFARLTGPGVDSLNGAGVWSESSGALALVARAGAAPPGAAAGVAFAAFADDVAPAKPGQGAGRTALNASLRGPGITFANERGVWSATGGALALLARGGDPAPGAAPGVVFSTLNADLNPAGKALLFGSVAGPGVTAQNNEAFWTDRAGSLQMLLREGYQAPDAPPGVLIGAGQFIGSPYTFEEIRWNSASELAVQANLVGPGVTTFSNEALFVEHAGEWTMVVREGDPAPGAGPGVTFGGNSVVLMLDSLTSNSLGHVAFNLRLGGASPTTEAFYSTHTGALAPVVWSGDPAPGTHLNFGIVGYSTLSDSGHIAFRGSLSTGGMYPPLGLWWDQPGAISALVVPGAPVPGMAGVTFGSVLWIDGFAASGHLAFRGTIDGPGALSRHALVLVDPSGEMRFLAIHGEPFDVFGDGSDVRIVEEALPGGLSAAGVVVFRVDFTDGTSGVFTAAFAAACPADLDGDGQVGSADLAIILGDWGQGGGSGDINGDLNVDSADIATVLGSWGACE